MKKKIATIMVGLMLASGGHAFATSQDLGTTTDSIIESTNAVEGEVDVKVPNKAIFKEEREALKLKLEENKALKEQIQAKKQEIKTIVEAAKTDKEKLAQIKTILQGKKEELKAINDNLKALNDQAKGINEQIKSLKGSKDPAIEALLKQLAELRGQRTSLLNEKLQKLDEIVKALS